MKEYIASFIKEKDLSENSQTAYSYDLDQFVDTVHNHVSDTNLRIYQASIKDFKPAVQKRKLSAVNQFLFYLYQHQVIEDYHRLVLPKSLCRKATIKNYWTYPSCGKGQSYPKVA